jgi:hypothetical protein
MLYTVKFLKNGCELKFAFREQDEMTEFLNTSIEAVEGYEEGTVQIILDREEDTYK